MRTVGYVNDNVPVALIEAAGFRAQRLLAAPCDITPMTDGHVKAQLPFRLARPPSTEAIIESVLTGEVGPLDYLVVPRAGDPVTEIYADLAAAKHASPSLHVPQLYFLDRNAWPSAEATAFNAASIDRFRARLEEWAGKPFDDGRLEETLGREDAFRDAVRELTIARAQPGSTIAGSAALAAIAAGAPLNACDEAGSDGLRIFLAGSDLHHPSLYAWLESCGANVVAEDHGLGQRLGERFSAPEDDPMAALRARFDTMPAGSASMPLAQAVELSVRRATNANVAAAIIFVYRHDRLPAWEAPSLRRALQQAGLPTLSIGEAPGNLPGNGDLADRVRTFVEEQR